MSMISEVERRVIVDLIREGKIQYFEDLLGPYKKTPFANDLKMNRGDISSFVVNVQRVNVRRIDQVGDLLQVDPTIIWHLAHKQFLEKIKPHLNKKK